MRSILTRAPGLLLSITLALVPYAAWAGPSQKSVPQDKSNPQRVNLAKTQDTTTEVRWQSIPQTKKEIEPWQSVGSTTRLDRSQPTPTTVRLQRVRTDLYAQRTTTYPQEAKEQRTKTTTTQNYELRTYTEQSTTSTALVPVDKEVGEWVTRKVTRPITTPVQRWRDVPKVRTVTVPIYRTETSTKSVPLLTSLNGSRTYTEQVPRKVSGTREVTTYVNQTVYYDGRTRDGWGYVKVLDEGRTIVTDYNPFVGGTATGGPMCPNATTFTLTNGELGGLNDKDEWVSWRITWIDTAHNDIYMEANSPGADTAYGVLQLNGPFSSVQPVPHKVFQSYEDTVYDKVEKTAAVPFSIQLEQGVTTAQERVGKPASDGICWKHFHGPNSTCPYQKVSGLLTNQTKTAERTAAEKGPLVGNAATRISALGSDEMKAFELVYHHTDVLPQYLDDIRIETATASVYDHDETREETYYEKALVTEQEAVQKVIGWTYKYPSYSYSHLHDAKVKCDNHFLVSSRGDFVTHSREPVLAPVTEQVSVTEWATHSVTVQELQTVTSTVSVLVSAVPGQEVSVSYSPWVASGETRPVGAGTVTIATRSVEVAGDPWIQNLTPDLPVTLEPIKPQSSTYTSDLSTGTKRQTLTGLALRLKIKANESIASKARGTQAGGSIGLDVRDLRNGGLGGQSPRPENAHPQSKDSDKSSKKQDKEAPKSKDEGRSKGSK